LTAGLVVSATLLVGFSACGDPGRAAKTCARAVGQLRHQLVEHPGAGTTQLGHVARGSFNACGSAALWSVPAGHDHINRLVVGDGSTGSALRVICNRYDRPFDTPVCEDKHENG
jgi:hypothetical protein